MIFVGSRLLGALAQAVMLFLLARGSSPERFGMISTITGLTILAVVITDFGMTGFLLREVARRRHESARIATVMVLGVTPLTAIAAAAAALAVVPDAPIVAILGIAIWGASERIAELTLAHLVGGGLRHRAS